MNDSQGPTLVVLAAGMGSLEGEAYDAFMREHDNHWV